MNQVAEIGIYYKSSPDEKPKVKTSNDAFKILLETWNEDTIELQEEFKVVLLNNSNEVLGIFPMSKGGISACVVANHSSRLIL